MKTDKLRAFFARKEAGLRQWLSAYTPPGMPMGGEYVFFLIALILAVLYAQGFLFRYYDAYMQLWEPGATGRPEVLITDISIAPFYEVFDHAWRGYLWVAFCMIGYGISHYTYYRQETKSIYLMRRLPDKWEYHRRALTTTVLELLICLLLALLTLFLDYLIYVTNTPQVCLPDHMLSTFFTSLPL